MENKPTFWPAWQIWESGCLAQHELGSDSDIWSQQPLIAFLLLCKSRVGTGAGDEDSNRQGKDERKLGPEKKNVLCQVPMNVLKQYLMDRKN